MRQRNPSPRGARGGRDGREDRAGFPPPSGAVPGAAARFTTALAVALLAFLAAGGCGKAGGEERAQAEELRSSYAEMRRRMAELEGVFLETEELLASSQGEELAGKVLRLAQEKRRLYGELVRELDGLQQSCEELGELQGEYAAYAAMLEELVASNKEEAAVLGGLLLTLEDLAKRLPLADPTELPPYSQRIDEAAARVEELRDALREGELRAEEEWVRR